MAELQINHLYMFTIITTLFWVIQIYLQITIFRVHV